ncbi:MAG: hypothetical protein ABII27_08965, partial [bacterium]
MKLKLYCAILLVPFSLVLLIQPAYSYTRIKTTEWSFGACYSEVLANPGTWTTPTITVYIPENGVTIKNAYLEFECTTKGEKGKHFNVFEIKFDSGTTASTIRNVTTGDYSYSTDEHERIFALVDVTSVIEVGANIEYTASVKIDQEDSSSHSMKLYITYEYDSTSSLQTKTVRFPLYSAANVCSKTSEVYEGQSYYFTYNADIEPTGITMRQQWFEVYGLRQCANSNVSGKIRIRIGSGSYSSIMYFYSNKKSNYDFRFIDEPDSSIP